jgi:Cu(I)/Ag(I) efflux system membrane fusion protein
MKPNAVPIVLVAVAALAAGGYGVYTLGMRHGLRMSEVAPAAPPPPAPREAVSKAGDVDPQTGKRVLYWHDPMVPGHRFDRPGKSPFMDMMLVPVYTEDDDDRGGTAVSPRLRQSLGIRTAEVRRGTIAPQIEAVGTIAFNERDQAVVPARAMGYVERLHVRATLDRVARGQPLAELYVPDWVAAQEELLSLRRMQGTDLAPLIDAARQRMRQAGMTDEQIREVERSGSVEPRVTLRAPIGGVVVELAAREGMTVMPGATLFRISGLGTVWANAEVPESQARSMRVGTEVKARSPALPGAVFSGRVQAILPEVTAATRTVKARVELANPGAQLAPGMFVSVSLAAAPNAEVLTVPAEALIHTGKRTVVMLAEPGGRFRAVDVEAGIEADGRTEIKRGLEAGQTVVVSGQFLIDSEASLRAATARMADAPDSAAPEAKP